MSADDNLGPADAAATVFDAVETTSGIFTCSRSVVDAGTRFDAHLHQEDQLAWMSSGSVEVGVQGERWHLRREHLAWIPAGLLHEMRFDEPGELLSVYADPVLRPPGDWSTPRTLRADELTGSLVRHLVDADPGPALGRRCHELLVSLVAAAPAEHDAIALPRDVRGRAVALALLEDPADARELAAWAGPLGVSAKTIQRAFVGETGSTFREWRVRVRLHRAAGLLSGGASVQHAAGAVGYESVSSFIAAFKARYGTTPARYAASASEKGRSAVA